MTDITDKMNRKLPLGLNFLDNNKTLTNLQKMTTQTPILMLKNYTNSKQQNKAKRTTYKVGSVSVKLDY